MKKDDIKGLLQKAGWFENRKIEVSHYQDILKNEEYSIFTDAIDFLEEYGDLSIRFKNPKRLDSYVTLNINPIDAAASIFRDISKRYEKYCNELFVIVGEIPDMDMTWYISSSGTFYGGNDDFLIRLGDNFMQALYNIVSGTKLNLITVEDE